MLFAFSDENSLFLKTSQFAGGGQVHIQVKYTVG
jgi:hypothetical protein